MNSRVVSITVLAGFAVMALSPISVHTLFASPAGQQDQKQNPNQNGKKDSKDAAALTGCVDEQDGRYVLVEDQNMTPIANLEADGFPKEGFAKHLGHKVTVRGTSIPGGALPSFKVRVIERISDTCAPAK